MIDQPTDAIRFLIQAIVASLAIGAFGAFALLLKSVMDFSRGGPQLKGEIITGYRTYLVYSLARLTFWVLLILWLMGVAGALLVGSAIYLAGGTATFGHAVVGALAGVVWITCVRFINQLLYLPAAISASLHYRQSRLYPLWRLLSPATVGVLHWGSITFATGVFGAAAVKLMAGGQPLTGAVVLLVMVGCLVILAGAASAREPRPHAAPPTKDSRPNILMIGSDTLRADRMGAAGYRRSLTPRLDTLASRGVQFTQCYVPCARTAPSLLSLFSGCWPHTHSVRDNFVAHTETIKRFATLPRILADAGYRTAAISDWAGSDLSKFDLGFQHCVAPPDQWNIKYLLRQGPKDLRLFLSLFVNNWLGRTFLPEIYYLAGIPLTRQIGRQTCRQLSAFARSSEPFMLNVFMATTHPPFGSEYPYYVTFADRKYAGESKFVMARLTDPFEVIRRQGDSRKDFDLDQIIDLYDGCVKSFDDEVGRILEHLDACGLTQSTIVVIYSDHGMELFEHETWGQGNSAIGDFSAKIPLIITDPRHEVARLSDAVTRSIDIAPTLLELAGLPRPAEMEGISLCAAWQEDARFDLPAFNETGVWLTTVPGMPPGHLHYPDLPDILDVPDKARGTLAISPEFLPRVIEAKDRMLRRGRWKLVYQPLDSGPLYRLFDACTDPGYKTDLSRTHPEIVSEMKVELLAWINAGQEPAATVEDSESGLTGRICLYVNNSPQPEMGERAKLGGGGMSLLTLWKMLPQFGWAARAVTPGEGPFTRAARDAGVPVTVYAYQQPDLKHPTDTLKNFLAWRRIIGNARPEIIHANAYDAARSMVLSAKSLGVKVICHVRFPMTDQGKQWVFRGLPTPDAFVFNSQALMDETWPILGKQCPKSRAYVVHNAVDLTAFTPSPWPESPTLRVGIIANLTPMKAHEDFLRMASAVLKRRADVEFWIIGEDTTNTGRDAMLKALARSLGIEQHVKFQGHRSDIPKMLDQLVVLTSHIEPFGRVLIEAMACGRPVIATNVGGIPEVVTEGKTGYLVPVGDYSAMASRVAELLADRQRWQMMSQDCVEESRRRFGVEMHAKAMIRIYEAVLGGKLP
jgi:arylsulfatase A-like enzyme/glycosyltransferase involved in cell wall biosynthesis